MRFAFAWPGAVCKFSLTQLKLVSQTLFECVGPRMGKRRASSVRFSSQNVRGLTDEKLEEIVRHMQSHGVMATCLMETWREGDDVLELHGFAVIQHGLPTWILTGPTSISTDCW